MGSIWAKFPFLRVILPFIIGIIFTIFNALDKHLIYFFTAISAIIWSSNFIFLSKKNEKVFGIAFLIFIMLFGSSLTLFHQKSYEKQHFYNYTRGKKIEAIIKIKEPLVEKDKSYKSEVEVLQVKSNNKTYNTIGRAIIYFAKDSNHQKLKYGDILHISSNFQKIREAVNPNQFNYKYYLSLFDIHHQIYVSKEQSTKIDNQGTFIVKFAFKLREHLVKKLKEHNIKGEEFQVAAALLLGYRELLEINTSKAYASAGAMHVLAVSGLHIGIVYIILQFLLRINRSNSNTKSVWIKTIIILLFLWFFALLTGMSPSVMRAATMFSFIAIGKATNRHSSIYNTLAASAFFLLIFDPFLIMKVGFQLSYLAVIGIVYLQPKINSLFLSNNKIINWVWNITSVSLAAQIATFPLGLYYFHQFPTLFFISNLVVIPCATLILGLGLAFFVFSSFSFISIVSTLISKLIYGVLLFMNKIIFLIKKWDYALIEEIDISILDSILIYLLILTIIIVFHSKRIYHLSLSLCVSIGLVTLQLKEKYTLQNKIEVVVYSIPKNTAIDIIINEKNYFLSHPTVWNNDKTMLFNVKHHWFKNNVINHQLIKLDSDSIYSGDNFYKNHDYFAIANSDFYLLHEKSQIPISLDVENLIITKNITSKIDIALNNIKFKRVIIDNSLSWRERNLILDKLEGYNCEIYDIHKEGAFILSL